MFIINLITHDDQTAARENNTVAMFRHASCHPPPKDERRPDLTKRGLVCN